MLAPELQNLNCFVLLQLPKEGVVLPDQPAGHGEWKTTRVRVQLLAPLREPGGQSGSGLQGGQTAAAGETIGQQAQVTISLDPDFRAARQRLQEKLSASMPR